jgi:hypothetical protein
LALPAIAIASTSHAGWPPVARQDKQINKDNVSPNTFTGHPGVHNELLGGHGDDTLIAADKGDILWGDYHPSGNTTKQHDTIKGGPGKDFIYASHGYNTISTGGGLDQVHAHYGSGKITCSNPKATVFLSHKSRPHYHLHNCPRISYKTVGY